LRIWLDINTPKQVLFLSKLAERLESRGHEVFKTARKYREVVQLLKLKRVTAKVVGEHGGPTLEGKLRASLSRALQLAKLIKAWRPDLAISFSSPEAARIAFGLKIPHYCVNDSPHAEAVARLTVPLSSKLFTPACIPKTKWIKLGIDEADIVQYRAVDPAAWLKGLKVKRRLRRRPLVVVRVEEEQASYLIGKEGKVVKIAEELLRRAEVSLVILPRYKEQVLRLKRLFKDKAWVPTRVIDSIKLLSKTHLFIGGGGTMTWEAALMGVPSISCTPLEGLDVERYLVELGLIRRAKSVDEAIKEADYILSHLEEELRRQATLAGKVLSEMEDPTEVIADWIEKAF